MGDDVPRGHNADGGATDMLQEREGCTRCWSGRRALYVQSAVSTHPIEAYGCRCRASERETLRLAAVGHGVQREISRESSPYLFLFTDKCIRLSIPDTPMQPTPLIRHVFQHGDEQGHQVQRPRVDPAEHRPRRCLGRVHRAVQHHVHLRVPATNGTHSFTFPGIREKQYGALFAIASSYLTFRSALAHRVTGD